MAVPVVVETPPLRMATRRLEMERQMELVPYLPSAYIIVVHLPYHLM